MKRKTRKFYGVIHKDSASDFSRCIMNATRKYAIKDFLIYNELQKSDWEKCKKDGWKCETFYIRT